MKTVVYYGSTTGTCEDLANRISAALGGADVKNASELGAEAAGYDLIVLGTSTWGDGEVQDDWYGALDTLKGLFHTLKTVLQIVSYVIADNDDTQFHSSDAVSARQRFRLGNTNGKQSSSIMAK